MRRLKGFWLFMLALTLILSACSSGDGGESESSADNTETSDQNNEEGNEDERLELNWFTPVEQASSILPDPSEDFVKQTIEDKFNVDLTIEYMPQGGTREDRLNVSIAGGDHPDMFVPASGAMTQKFALDGLLADLTPFVSPETMPNYYEWVTEVEQERYEIQGEFVRAANPFARNVYRSYYIRKDWLDHLELDVPESYDELMDVMRAFTFDDPDGNGQDDTYGMSASGNGDSISLDFPQWIHNDLIAALMIEDNTFVYNYLDPRVGDVADDVVEMLDEGIVDPDWFLNEGLDHHDTAAQGRVGVVVGSTRDFIFESNPNSLLNQTRAVIPEADWIPFNPFPDKPGIWSEPLPSGSFVFPKAIAEESPEKIERTVEILDWLASEEGYLLTRYGKEGEHYTRDGDTITIDPDAISEDIIEKGNFLDVYDFFTPEAPDVLGLEVIDPRMSDWDREVEETINSYKAIPSIGTNIAPPDDFNLADFGTKMREYHTQMIFEDKSGENWPEYREELLTEYRGQDMMDAYVEQIREAGIDVEN